MAQEPGSHHSWRQTPPNEVEILHHGDSEHECPFDLMQAAVPAGLARESRRIMDGLLRECLKSKRPSRE
jgi:hypothetical protein